MTQPFYSRLYRSLKFKSNYYDKYPALKALLLSSNGPWKNLSIPALQTYYSPSFSMSFSKTLPTLFRKPLNGVNTSSAFSALKSMNETANKHFDTLYGGPPLAKPYPIAPLPHTIERREDKAHITTWQHIKRWWRPPSKIINKYWVHPIPVSPLMTLPNTEDKAEKPHNLTAIKPGVLLLAHPLISSSVPESVKGLSFPKCVLLITKVTSSRVSALVLNFPHTTRIGQDNYVFPKYLQHRPCHFGGRNVYVEGGQTTQEYPFPPVPNYSILHCYPTIRYSKVLIPDQDGHPVCLSSASDLPYIDEFIKKNSPRLYDFMIFIGSVDETKDVFERAISQGVWMPIESSASFVRNAGRLGPDLWDGVLEMCGGEYKHMRQLQLLDLKEETSKTTDEGKQLHMNQPQDPKRQQ